MRIYVNRKAVRGPWGGENSFMGALCRWLEGRGCTITVDRSAPVDIALLNALTQIDFEFVRSLAERGVPIVHRKVGFVVSGSQEQRAVRDGVVEGDRRQIAFSPYIKHSIFQSRYSRDLFASEGFSGPHSILHNGVDEAKFNLLQPGFLGLTRRPRNYWREGEPFSLLAVSWSADPAKGFEIYRQIDEQIAGSDAFSLRFVGRRPEGLTFKNIPSQPPLPHKKLAMQYRNHHALLFLGRQETCSNTILEGINCGMAVIFHPSGASPETAGRYGTAYSGDIFADVERIKANYSRIVAEAPDNPYKISKVGPKYLEILKKVAAGEPVDGPNEAEGVDAA